MPSALGYDKPLCAALEGFTLHAATRAGGSDVRGRDALLRYVLRTPLAQERPTPGRDGLVRIAFERAYADGTVAVEVDPLSLSCRLAASVPPPRYHTVKDAGVLASASHRRVGTPAPPGTRSPPRGGTPAPQAPDRSPRVMTTEAIRALSRLGSPTGNGTHVDNDNGFAPITIPNVTYYLPIRRSLGRTESNVGFEGSYIHPEEPEGALGSMDAASLKALTA